jgi:hypothetical protein
VVRLTGELPSDSAERFRAAFNDTHVYGLVEHCVGILVWRRTMIGFCAGVVAGFLLGFLR